MFLKILHNKPTWYKTVRAVAWEEPTAHRSGNWKAYRHHTWARARTERAQKSIRDPGSKAREQKEQGHTERV